MPRLNETKLKVLVISLTLVLGLSAIWVFAIKPDELPDARRILKQIGNFVPVRRKPTRFQVDVIRQEIAVPGKVIQAQDEHGVELLKYKCKPEDAAIVLFTMRNIANGADVFPTITTIQDPEGREYFATIESGSGAVKVLALKRGFAKKPSRVEVKFQSDEADGSKPESLQVTEIADPIRHLSPPQGKELVEAEKVARADLHVDRGYVEITLKEKPPRGQFEIPSIIDSTYLPMGEVYYSLPPHYIENIDAVKVRIDRKKNDYVASTLIYRNAQIIQIGGNNFLSLPVMQDVGTVDGHTLMIGNTAPSTTQKSSKPGAHVNNQTLTFRWNPKENLRPGAPPSHRIKIPMLELVSITPTVAEMGLGSLRIVIPGALLSGGPVSGLDSTIHSTNPSSTALVRTIPELRISIRAVTQSNVSSKTVLLPVHRRLQRVAPTTPLSKH